MTPKEWERNLKAQIEQVYTRAGSLQHQLTIEKKGVDLGLSKISALEAEIEQLEHRLSALQGGLEIVGEWAKENLDKTGETS